MSGRPAPPRPRPSPGLGAEGGSPGEELPPGPVSVVLSVVAVQRVFLVVHDRAFAPRLSAPPPAMLVVLVGRGSDSHVDLAQVPHGLRNQQVHVTVPRSKLTGLPVFSFLATKTINQDKKQSYLYFCKSLIYM